MTELTFTLKINPQQRVDVSPLTPDNLNGKSLPDIAAIELQTGNRKIRVDDLFAISGDDASTIVIKQASNKLDYIGKGNSSGEIIVEGDAGAYLGFQLKGGVIKVSGNVDAYAACELRNGEINIDGNAGDFLGAALPGNKKGMQGGVVIVKGNAGDRVGDHMRRGSDIDRRQRRCLSRFTHDGRHYRRFRRCRCIAWLCHETGYIIIADETHKSDRHFQ
jgi:formylmethanofuran dehydrogenase subunit C